MTVGSETARLPGRQSLIVVKHPEKKLINTANVSGSTIWQHDFGKDCSAFPVEITGQPGLYFFLVTLKVKTLAVAQIHDRSQIERVIRGGAHQTINGIKYLADQRIDADGGIFITVCLPD